MAESSAIIEDSARALWTLMNELYDVRAKWKDFGLGLFFPESDLDAISGTPQECLRSLLSKWLKRLEPPPTWDRLVAVLRSRVIGEEKKAQELEEKFCGVQKRERVTPTHFGTAAIPTPAPYNWPTPPAGQSETSGALPCLEREATVSESGSPLSPSFTQSAATEDNALVDVLSPARPSLQRALDKISHPEIRKKLKRRDFTFRALVGKIRQHLSRVITTPEKLSRFKAEVSNMPASLHGHHLVLSPEDRREIAESQSLDPIFVVLNQYWTFVQYELLEYVAKQYGSAALLEEMEAYVAEMDELEEEIGIDHITAVRLCYQRPNSVAIEVHLSSIHRTLSSLRQAQKALAEQCELFPHTVRTYQSRPGSTVLTLLIPYSVAGHVLATLRGLQPARELLSKPVEERVVYTMEEPETEMYLPMTVSETILFPERQARKRKRRGSGDSSSIGYLSKTTDDTASAVEASSQIFILKNALLQKEKEVKEFQDKIIKEPAHETRAVCILGSVAPLSNESVIPQSPADLSDEEQVLEGLGLPPDLWANLNALLALYGKTENYDVFSVQVSKPGMELSRSYILEQIEFLLKNSNKKTGGAVLHYYGNGRRGTGDWCFRDGFITFRDITDSYMKHSRGRVLNIVPDCHSSGHWVSECARFLDEQGVKACGHSAKEKGILLMVNAACRTGQDTAELSYTTQAMVLKDDGYVYHWTSKELSARQKAFGVPFTDIRCGEEEGEKCSMAPESIWSTAWEVIYPRVFRVRRKDRDRPGWNIVLLADDAEKIKSFHEAVASGTVEAADYGTILQSGLGANPPEDIVEQIIKKHGFSCRK